VDQRREDFVNRQRQKLIHRSIVLPLSLRRIGNPIPQRLPQPFALAQ
jgi:hypothetical protein